MFGFVYICVYLSSYIYIQNYQKLNFKIFKFSRNNEQRNVFIMVQGKQGFLWLIEVRLMFSMVVFVGESLEIGFFFFLVWVTLLYLVKFQYEVLKCIFVFVVIIDKDGRFVKWVNNI